MYFVGSILFWIFFLVVMVFMFFPALLIWLLTLPFDKNKRVLHQYSCFWGSLYTWFNPFISVEILGKEKLNKASSYVYCANHQSMMDIVILYRLFLHFKWVSKKEILKVPFLGWNMCLNNYLFVSRGSPSSQIRMMKGGERLLNQGSSLMIFPEGTRSKNGLIGRFHDGAFVLSQKTNSPIVPVVIKGSSDVFSDGTILYRRKYNMSIQLLEPIIPHKEDSPKAFGRYVREKFLEELGQSET